LNLSALARVVDFLERQRILLYRISSNLIPFASHNVNTVEWSDEFAEQFSELGARIRALGIRVSTHPGQFTVLNSPHVSVVDAARRELAYQARMLDAFGADATSKIVIHIGGLYGGSEAAAMDRFVIEASRLPDPVLRRLVVENDDRIFNAEDALQTARRIGVPAVFDWLHHQVNPCRREVGQVLADMFDTWTPQDGRPKVHLSSQAAGCLAGAHAEYVSLADAEAFLAISPAAPFDCMLEAKQKDRALLQLRADLTRRNVIEADIAPLKAIWHSTCDHPQSTD
jgi:UV DNA damage endonuclease